MDSTNLTAINTFSVHAMVEEMTQVILSSDNEKDILYGLTKLTGIYFQLERTMMFKVDLKEQLAKALTEWTVENRLDIASTLGDYPLEIYNQSVPYMLHERQPIISHADDIHPLLAQEPSGQIIHNELKIHTVLWYPVYFYEDGLYVLVFNKMDEKRVFDEEDIKNIAMLSKLLQMALQKIKYLHEIEAQSALYKHTSTQLENVIEAIPDAIFFKDGKGGWQIVNEIGKQLFQLENVDWIGKTDMELAELQPHLKAAYENCLLDDNQAWEKGSLYTAEEHVIDEEGQTHTFDVRKVPLYESDGSKKGLIVIGRDVTAYMNLNDELKKLNASLEARIQEETEKNRQKDFELHQQAKKMALKNLLINISHHWRQPLTVLGLKLDNLLDKYTEGQMSETLFQETIRSNLKIIQEMSATINQFGKLMAPKEAPMPFDINQSIRNIAWLYGPLLSDSDITLEVTCYPEQLFFHSSESEFVQNIVSLMENSLDAINATDAISRSISLSTTSDQEMIQLLIEDTGGGISPENLTHIFDPYFSTKDKCSRVGLTLYFIREFIELHQGSISLENFGEGTRCTIKLPRYHQPSSN